MQVSSLLPVHTVNKSINSQTLLIYRSAANAVHIPISQPTVSVVRGNNHLKNKYIYFFSSATAKSLCGGMTGSVEYRLTVLHQASAEVRETVRWLLSCFKTVTGELEEKRAHTHTYTGGGLHRTHITESL